MRGWAISYTDFSGGLNTQAAPYLLQGNQCREALNVHTSAAGDIEKRNGFVTVSGASLTGEPVKATGVHTLFPVNTTTKSLLGVATTSDKDKIFKMTQAGVATVLKSELTANTRWYWAQCEVDGSAGPIFGINGVDTPQKWNGEASETSEWKATTGEVPKTAKYLTYFASRLWCAEGSRLRFSGITGSSPDPLNWNSEEYVDLEPNDGQSITGIGVIGSYLIVFKSRKTYQIYDPTSGANRQLSNAIGCVAHRSIVQTPAGLFFLSEDQGICRTDGKVVTPFSDPIKPQLEEVASRPTTAANAAGTLMGRRYYLSVSLNGTRNDHTLEYDLETASWWLHDCASNQYALVDPGGTPTLYSADSAETARVSNAFAEEIFQDNGANYAGNSFYVTPHYAWGTSGSFRYMRYVDPHRAKRIREMRMDGIGTWESYIATDFSPQWHLMDGETWSVSGTNEGGFFEVADGTEFEGTGDGTFMEETSVIVDRHYHTPGVGKTASFKFEDTTGSNFKIRSATIAIAMRED